MDGMGRLDDMAAQHKTWLDKPRRLGHTSSPFRRRFLSTLSVFCTVLALLISSTNAASVEFQNCLDSNTINSHPLLLQFTPLHIEAFFNTASANKSLNVTVYGNVSGQTTIQSLPPPNSPQWTNPNDTLGKIVDLSSENNKYTTLFTRYNVLNYIPFEAKPARFCDAVLHQECPVAPAFFVDPRNWEELRAFSVAHDFFSTYAFTSFTATLTVESGDLQGNNIACISIGITPDIGHYLRNVLTYLPLVVLVCVGIATVTAAIFSPWSVADTFRWTSNYGRDADVLRLVTPGFGDCLQYIQFIILTGSLSLNYPGFYQPVVSRVGWSSLMFNESFVTHGHGTQSVVDGVYHYRSNTTYGLDQMSQLIGMTSPRDIWADMIIWLVVIVGAVAVLTQIGFASQWLYRQVANVPAEDLRSKNWPFTAGNVVRSVLNYFLLPLVSLSMFQLVIAGQGPSYSVALAAVVLVGLIAFSARLVHLFIHIRPRSFLFDDWQTVLTYGPLYNTYCDDAATFAMIPIFLNFLRGIAIGAVQASGIAQLVLLAICEIVLVLTINAFRPFPTATSMNIYQTFFASIRLVTILLSIAFLPSLGVSDASRGWIGYAILLIHACVLVFGFFLNSLQTLIEVVARRAGAGRRSEMGGAAARGGLTRVFGMRQLSRRMPRREQPSRHSMASNAAMMQMDADQKSLQLENARSRSISASSTMLLKQATNDGRQSQNDNSAGAGNISPDATSSRSKARASSRMSGGMSPGAIVGIKQVESQSKDPYYRQPRRNTMEPTPSRDKRERASGTSGDFLKRNSVQADEEAIEDDVGEGASAPPVQDNDDFEDVTLTKTKTDYAVREVDFYYGVRGPALSSGTRKLKTGPADPTGPVSSATGWFKGLLGGKTKEKGKGFEVVRSSRAPPPALFQPTRDITPGDQAAEPYHDDPSTPERQRKPVGSLDAQPGVESDDNSSGDESEIPRIGSTPPTLPKIDTVGAIELPSRIGSESSRKSKRRPLAGFIPAVPAIPRRSSRRTSSQDAAAAESGRFPQARLQPVAASPPNSPPRFRELHATSSASGRIPFAATDPSPAKSNRYSVGAESMNSSLYHPGDEENQAPAGYVRHSRHPSSVLGAHAPDLRQDRPSSVGFVQQHRASDNIHYSPDSVESSAEVYGHPSQR